MSKSRKGVISHGLLIIVLLIITLGFFVNAGWARPKTFCLPGLVRLKELYTTDHFSIHYNVPGQPDGVNDLNYISRLGAALEEAYNTYSRYGFPLPQKVTVRVCDLANDGQVMPLLGISIDNDLSDNQLKGTAAHELFHVVQYRYLTVAPKYIFEGTAYFMEHVVFPDSEDYVTWICYALTDLNKRFFLDRFKGTEEDNAAVLYWQYAAEQYSKTKEDPPGVMFIKKLWEAASRKPKGQLWGDFLDKFLQQQAGITFRESFTNWIAANYIRALNNIDSKYQYRYNDKYKCITGPLKIASVGNCPQCKPKVSFSNEIVAWGAFYNELRLHPGVQGLEVSFEKGSRPKTINARDFIDLQTLFIKGEKDFSGIKRISLVGQNKVQFRIDNEGYSKIVFIIGGADRGASYQLNIKTLLYQDTTPPALITNFQASDGEDRKSTLTWTNPPDSDLAEVLVRRKLGSYPTNHTDGDLVYQSTSPAPGAGVTHVDTDLTNGTTYYYAVFSRDQAGNWNDQVVEGQNADTGKPQALLKKILLYFGNGGANPGQFGGQVTYNTLTARYESQGYEVSYTDIFPSVLDFKVIFLLMPGVDDDSGVNFFTNTQVENLKSFLRGGRRLIILGDNSGFFGIKTVNDLLSKLEVGIRQNADLVTQDADNCPPLTNITDDQITRGVSGLDLSASSSLSLSGTAKSLVRVQDGYTCPPGTAGATVIAVDQIPGSPSRPGADVIVIGDTQGLDDWTFSDPAGDGIADNYTFADNLVNFEGSFSNSTAATKLPRVERISIQGIAISTVDGNIRFSARGLGIQNIQIHIFNLSGQLVFRTDWVENGFVWNLLNDRGQRLANGVYLYVITYRRDDGTVLKSPVKKLVVLR